MCTNCSASQGSRIINGQKGSPTSHMFHARFQTPGNFFFWLSFSHLCFHHIYTHDKWFWISISLSIKLLISREAVCFYFNIFCICYRNLNTKWIDTISKSELNNYTARWKIIVNTKNILKNEIEINQLLTFQTTQRELI